MSPLQKTSLGCGRFLQVFDNAVYCRSCNIISRGTKCSQIFDLRPSYCPLYFESFSQSRLNPIQPDFVHQPTLPIHPLKVTLKSKLPSRTKPVNDFNAAPSPLCLFLHSFPHRFTLKSYRSSPASPRTLSIPLPRSHNLGIEPHKMVIDSILLDSLSLRFVHTRPQLLF